MSHPRGSSPLWTNSQVSPLFDWKASFSDKHVLSIISFKKQVSSICLVLTVLYLVLVLPIILLYKTLPTGTEPGTEDGTDKEEDEQEEHETGLE